MIALVRALKPDVRIVVGGYDPSLAPEAWVHPDAGADVIVRGEGDIAFRLLRAFEAGRPLDRIDGLWFRDGATFRRNPPARSARLRRARYGLRNVPRASYRAAVCSAADRRRGDLARLHIRLQLLLDHPDARTELSSIFNRAGDRRHRRRSCAWRAHIFFVDDNITLDTDRFEALCRAIIAAGLNRIDYFVQAMTASIATTARRSPLMQQAGFRYVFLGIENILDEDLAFLKARQEQPAPRGHTNQYGCGGDRSSASPGMLVVGGLIVGQSDRRESIAANLTFARRYIDWPYIQHRRRIPARR